MKLLLKVVSIICIIFGAIACIMGLVTMFGGGVFTAYFSFGLAALVVVLGLLAIIGGVLELLVGLFGLAGLKGDLGKLKAGIILSIIGIAISVISMIVSIFTGSFSLTSLIGLVLPILYIYSGNAVMNGKE